MYKCTECGSEYEIKPDFCDCGNDEFVITVEDTPVVDKQTIKEPEHNDDIQSQPVQKTVKQNEPEDKINNYKPHLLPKELHPASLVIFLICIILSIIVICIKPNDTIADKPQNTTVVEKSVSQIPNIDKFWNNGVNYGVKSTSEQIIEVEQPKPQQVKTVQTQPVKKQTQPKQQTKVTTVPIKKTTQTTKTTQIKSTKQPVTKITQNQTQTVQQKTQTTTQKAQTVQQNTQTPAKTQVTSQQTRTVQPQTAAQTNVNTLQPKVNTEALKQELSSYKAKLRNTIGQKIDFTKVVGDGNCVVSFKINSSGKLVNRAFAKQSTNITLNDAVYKAVMSTPTFNPPPSGYNNETLNLNIKFYNGNFEISLN